MPEINGSDTLKKGNPFSRGLHGGNRMKHKDKWQPIVLMILTTLIAMGAFYWIKSWDSTRFLPRIESIRGRRDGK